MNDKLALELGCHLAREVFKVGDDPGHLTTRIQFMSCQLPNEERAGGGLCEGSLATLLAARLRAWIPSENDGENL